jgi:hypothetical protein
MTVPRVVIAAVVVLALVVGFVVPAVTVLCVVVALNFVLGPGENVPFSMYPMFAHPAKTAWTLRFEDGDGELVPIAMMGINPVEAKKSFATELRSAAGRGLRDVSARERSAAEVVARQIEQHRPPVGQWAETPISIVLVEFTLKAGRAQRNQRSLIETRPG